jgi:hypothetical protein
MRIDERSRSAWPMWRRGQRDGNELRARLPVIVGGTGGGVSQSESRDIQSD